MAKSKYFDYSIEQLKAIIEKRRGFTPEDFYEASLAYTELMRRAPSTDMRYLRDPLLPYMVDTARGKLAPMLVLSFGVDSRIMGYLGKIVIEDQIKVAHYEAKVDVWCPDGAVRSLRVSSLSDAQFKQVFGDGRIRTPAEQKRHVPKVVPVSAHTRNGASSNGSAADSSSTASPDSKTAAPPRAFLIHEDSDYGPKWDRTKGRNEPEEDDLTVEEAFLDLMDLSIKQQRELKQKRDNTPLAQFIKQTLVRYKLISADVPKKSANRKRRPFASTTRH